MSLGSLPQDPPQPPVLNFVMATDKNYIIPTLVAMYSVIKNCKGCLKHFIIFVGPNRRRKVKQISPQKQAHSNTSELQNASMRTSQSQNSDSDNAIDNQSQNAFDETPAPDEQDEKKLRSLTASDVRVSIIDIQYTKKIDASIIGNTDGLICLRAFVPSSFQRGEVSDKNAPQKTVLVLSDYLWLDSDVLVVKDLKEMYASCKKQNQPIIGSNYLYIGCNLKTPLQGDIFYSPDAQQHHPISMTNWKETSGGSRSAPYQCRVHNNFQISGGVVFFNLEIKRQQEPQVNSQKPLSKLPFLPFKKQFQASSKFFPIPVSNRTSQVRSFPQIFKKENDFSILISNFTTLPPADRTEEFAMTQYLFSLGHLHYILPTTYNCRLCYPEVASVLLNSSLIAVNS